MKKKLMTVVLFGLMTSMLLTGCTQSGKSTSNSAVTGNSSAATTSTGEKSPETKDITFYGVNDPQISVAQIVADKMGYFKEEGLNVTNKFLLNTSEIAPLMANGQAKISSSNNYATISWVNNGAKIKFIAPTVNMGGTQWLLLRKGLSIKSAKELEGLKMGQVPGSSQNVTFLNMSKAIGIDPTKIKHMPLQFPDQLAAMLNGSIDIMAVPEPWATKAEAEGATLLASGTKSYVPGFEGDVNWCNMYAGIDVQEDFLKNNPETVKRILKALKKANDYVVNNKEKTVEMLAVQFGLSTSDLTKIMSRNVYSFGVDDKFLKSTDDMAKFIFDQKITNKELKREEYISFDLLKEAVPEAYSATK
ncbi:MAG: nitrate/sulfonate/bicarbonate transporter substrate-binding protein [Clostridiales bacterium]|nr:nitrate/sulfonate/bicarbonate transporter substrate-binding protein [Clostridiales bacterium]